MLIGKIKEIKFLKKLIGRTMPTYKYGHSGRKLENIFEDDYGITVNRKAGPDNEMFGIEYKTRDLDATSPQTIGSMSVRDIIQTKYEDSDIFKKFQQQVRVKTKDNIIVEADLYDFRSAHIQDNIKAAYEYARAQLTANPTLQATKTGPLNVGHWGYFENTSDTDNTRSFRVSQSGMDHYEAMTKANFNGIFDYGN